MILCFYGFWILCVSVMCISCGFSFLFNSVECFFIACLISKERTHAWSWMGRDVGENLGGETMTRIYHMKKIKINK